MFWKAILVWYCRIYTSPKTWKDCFYISRKCSGSLFSSLRVWSSKELSPQPPHHDVRSCWQTYQPAIWMRTHERDSATIVKTLPTINRVMVYVLEVMQAKYYVGNTAKVSCWSESSIIYVNIPRCTVTSLELQNRTNYKFLFWVWKNVQTYQPQIGAIVSLFLTLRPAFWWGNYLSLTLKEWELAGLKMFWGWYFHR